MGHLLGGVLGEVDAMTEAQAYLSTYLGNDGRSGPIPPLPPQNERALLRKMAAHGGDFARALAARVRRTVKQCGRGRGRAGWSVTVRLERVS